MPHKLPDAFSKNRSEETSEDNWAEFVVPPYLHDLGIKAQSKAIVIMGGRGCGKTTLLRYFSHATQFSQKRGSLPDDALAHIGLYWRADTNFLNAFVGGEQSSQTWRSAFDHALACDLGIELIRSVRNLNCNRERREQYGGLDTLDLSAICDFDENLTGSLLEVEQSLLSRRRKLSAWLNNLDTEKKPHFLPAQAFLTTLIDILRSHLSYLRNSNFAVFVDEYENLRDEQQQFINGLLKHGKPPLLFNIAMKRNGWQTSKTTGPEPIQRISDFHVVDLEEEVGRDFVLFAAELLFFRLAEHVPLLLDKLPISTDQLRDIEQIESRYGDPEYRSRVIAAAEELLPRMTERGAAVEIVSDPRLRERLRTRIDGALQKSGSRIAADDFIDPNFPEASVVVSALLHRPREEPSALLLQIKALKQGEPSRLASTNPLITNNLFGCVNAIFIDANVPSMLCSGFTSLILIARENIRHLLELVQRVFRAYERTGKNDDPLKVPPRVQAKAVKEASELILRTVSGHGKHGPQLYNLAQCLGAIFLERHKSLKQSEPEVNHFTLSGGDVSSRVDKYLLEAEKWSVLFRTRETKMKSTGAADADYILNPIFSPFFQISFRKKRSIPFSAKQILVMLEGDQLERDALVRELSKQSAGDSTCLDLFSEERE